ncbi:MAG: DUF429 domain-containing protein [Sulfurihydrogenibium sp.]|nr:MAG: DUF429 domain-containing protein [Sulfurihydrogenibium sp.]
MENFKILGLDLAGSPKRKTGYAYLENGKLQVGVLFQDEDILNLAKNFKLVMIDAPLSLPEGRLSLEEIGPHFRECDIKLREMGIKFFPLTLGPMRMLTKRAISIKDTLSKEGIHSIETFPGGLYDIYKVNRKEKDAIKNLYKKLGFYLEERDYFQDELDAVACLISGIRYVSSKAIILDGKDGLIVI